MIPLQPSKFLLFFPLLWSLSCTPQEATAVQEFSFCDLYQQGECLLPREVRHTYRPRVPPAKREQWYDFDYYLYFHSRETPGFRVRFDGVLAPPLRERLESTLRCHYTLVREGRSIHREMEGVRVDHDGSGFWCFDYLGSMLIAYHKEYGMERERPRNDFFPVRVIFGFESALPFVQGEKEAQVDLKVEN